MCRGTVIHESSMSSLSGLMFFFVTPYCSKLSEKSIQNINHVIFLENGLKLEWDVRSVDTKAVYPRHV